MLVLRKYGDTPRQYHPSYGDVSPCLLAGYDKVKLDVDNSWDKNRDLGKEALLRSTKILGKAASFALFA